MQQPEGQRLGKEGQKPADGVALGGEVLPFEAEVELWQIVEDVDVHHVAEFSHLLLPVLVVDPEPHLFEEIAA